jgi:coproporphyrinogen III oxidase-like Fe-S oxidoreductase
MFAERLKSHHELHDIMQDLAITMMDTGDYLKNLPGVPREGVIYVHVPFCRKICSFCNMRRVLGEPDDDYARLLIRESELYRDLDYVRNMTFSAVYFGGGTPTTLSSRSIEKIMAALRKNFCLADDAEITFESTVTELTGDKIDSMMECGVNRISVGVQTFSDRGRRLLGRLGSGEEACRKLLEIKARGLENVNIDLIYNYPGQTLQEVDEDLDRAISLDLGGFSFYSLITQPGARLGSPAYDTDMALFDRIYTRAVDQGFTVLELTKLVRHDPYRYITARHNGLDTLALGAGAGGNLTCITYMNPIELKEYRHYVESCPDVNVPGVVTKPQFLDVSRLIGAVQQCRIPRNGYQEMLGGEENRELVNRLLSEGYATEAENAYPLTKKGIYWGNSICDAILKNLKF